jgi:sulfatase modifying factor 1
MASRHAGWVVLVAVIVAACAESSGGGTSDPSPDGGPLADGSTPAQDGGAGDARSDARDDAGSGGEKISTVPAGAVRITPTEVTGAQYAEFLGDTEGKAVAQPAACAWNTTFAPPTSAGCALGGNGPIRCVDWCDARAFCEWAGLRLCAKDEWLGACGGKDNDPYPYGASLNQAACQFADPGGPVDVGSKATCEGGYPGLFDMLGNVREWDDACQGTAGANDRCGVHGGDYGDDADAFECSTAADAARNEQSPKLGIRCCSK